MLDTTEHDTNDIELDHASTYSGDAQSRKGSIYLDAVSDPLSEGGPGLNEILRELREIPEIPSTASGPSDRTSLIVHPHTNRSIPLFLEPSTSPSGPGPSAIIHTPIHAPTPTAPHRSNRSRTLRHSFSSSIVPSRTTAPPSGAGMFPRDTEEAEATVELHEESAVAFQDFLFWAYPHLECKVTWTNVQDVRLLFSW